MKKLFLMMMLATVAGSSMAQNSAIKKARAIFDASVTSEAYKGEDGQTHMRTIVDWDKVQEAQETLTPAFKHEKTKDFVGAWLLQGEIHERYMASEINKAVEQQPLDTLALFERIGMTLDAYKECIEAEANVKNKVNTPILCTKMANFRQYYLYCGQFFSNNGDTQHSFEAFYEWFMFPERYALIGEEYLLKSAGDTDQNQIAYFAALTAYQSKQFDKMDIFREQALAYTEQSETAHQLYLAALQEKGDTAAWLALGEEFAMEGSAGDGIVQNLMAYYLGKKDNDKVIAFADKLMQKRPQDKLGPYARGLVAFNDENYEEAVVWFDKALDIDPDYFEALYQGGVCYLNIAFNLNDALSNKRMTAAENQKALEPIRECCRKAEPYFLHIREIRPDEAVRWAPRLRQIYYILDDKEKLDEVAPYCEFEE